MELRAPFIISSRLLPALKIGNCTLSADIIGTTPDGRERACVYFDWADGTELTDDSLRSGVGGFADPTDPLRSSLSFLAACAESLAYAQRTGRAPSENADLYALPIAEWAVEHSDEIECIACEIEES